METPSKLTHVLGTGHSDRVQHMLVQLTETSGEDIALQVAAVIQQEIYDLQYGVYEPRLAVLTRQLDDALTVVRLQEKELFGKKGNKAHEMRAKIAELEQRCADLQAKLDRQPVDEAMERTRLAEELMLQGEKKGYRALYCDAYNDRLIDKGFDAYLTFAFAQTTSLEKLQLANAATQLILQAQAGRQKLAKMQP